MTEELMKKAAKQLGASGEKIFFSSIVVVVVVDQRE